jgi:hypothetical protein
MRLLARYSRIAAALLIICGLSAAGLPAASPRGVRLDPSKTWVGLARVYLEVEDLELTGDGLAGEYRIRVPLKPSENDAGQILLAVDSMDQLQIAGGRLLGEAQSSFGKVHTLACEILENGRILVQVTSDERTLSFKTRMRELN